MLKKEFKYIIFLSVLFAVLLPISYANIDDDLDGDIDDIPQEERSVNSPDANDDSIDLSELDALDENDKKLLKNDDFNKALYQGDRLKVSDQEEDNDIDSLKEEISEVLDISKKKKVIDVESSLKTGVVKKKGIEAVEIFDVGEEERKLLQQIDSIKGKIPDDEWETLYSASKPVKYVIQEGDYLWKISQRLFGSGFYYAKVWALNPQITNPHEVEPGMVLVFETGDENLLPTVRLGNFDDLNAFEDKTYKGDIDLSEFGESNSPAWLTERRKLKSEGAFFQTLSEEDYGDFNLRAKAKLNTEYKKFMPDAPYFAIETKDDNYDNVGFDKNSKISFNFNSGFHLNTFVSTNIVQDFGYIEALPDERSMIHPYDTIYVNFDKNVSVNPGDLFSVYKPQGKVEHEVSDRDGYQYTITAQIKAIRKINNLWECEVIELSSITKRFDRLVIALIVVFFTL